MPALPHALRQPICAWTQPAGAFTQNGLSCVYVGSCASANSRVGACPSASAEENLVAAKDAGGQGCRLGQGCTGGRRRKEEQEVKVEGVITVEKLPSADVSMVPASETVVED
eukprot:GABV01011944.1.p2 GENE.GABV01011944.1~~GABV01011944.1.p2  ORF type:complete len:112 (-),score=30.99 GABV01011944.1:11-346(-)